MLLGRSSECARLLALVDKARRGESGALLIRGEAGIGKTSLLEHVAGESGDLRRLGTRGVEVESDLPYVGLADLLRPVLHFLDRIPERQAAALTGALALGPAVAHDRFAVAAGTLSLLGALAEEGPVLVTVDDAQWLDPYSLDALAFATRRLGREGIVVLFTARDELDEPASRLAAIETMTLGGLDAESAHRLIAEESTAELTEREAARLLAEARGNPLALIELPALLSGSGAGDDDPDSAAPLPIGELLAHTFGSAVARLPQEAQDAMLLLAVLGTRPLAGTEAALRAHGLSYESLEAAEAAGLVVEEQDGYAFRHPLVRSAVYHGATPVRRRRAHHAIARSLQGATAPALEQYAWHLAASGAEPDEHVASLLENAASGAPDTLPYPLASRLYERAARFTPAGQRKAERLLCAARASQAAGSLDEAAAILDRSLEHAEQLGTRLDIRQLRCYLDVQRGQPTRSRELLRAAVDEAEKVDPALAAVMLGGIALTELAVGDLTAARGTSAAAMELADATRQTLLPVRLLRTLVLLLGGDADAGRSLLRELAGPLASPDPAFPYPLSGVGGLCHLAAEELDEAHGLLDRAAYTARASSAVGLLSHLLCTLSVVEFWRGRWSPSLAHADEAVRLAEATGRLIEVPRGLAALARTEAALNREADCRRHAAQAMEWAASTELPMDAARARGALGLLELGLGRFEEAVHRLEEVRAFSRTHGRGDGLYLTWAADLADAYVHLHMTTEAREVLDVLEYEAGRGHRPVTAGAAARCRGLLEPDAAERHMRRSLALLTERPVPFERGRTEFAWGEQLRRQGRRSEARRLLERALATFERLGASGWAARVAAELHAAGGTEVRPERAPLERLTPQEMQVALVVGRGLTNHEVAERLFLSVKTVEFHLSNIYRKLDGVHRRAQLVRLLAQASEVAAV
ncbi:ATP-binding protein [Streptomyces sp. KN37]|uniref:ATP-binding protein n=1 Tax=Streptomyces sp. KN37 TaxID=3090667 RepID=UPI002A751225|nr:AAA family ATPase [Streptomyces sp. KN37]WPO69992.1 AAA family ATPase [Streptomyces sp. KN37]